MCLSPPEVPSSLKHTPGRKTLGRVYAMPWAQDEDPDHQNNTSPTPTLQHLKKFWAPPQISICNPALEINSVGRIHSCCNAAVSLHLNVVTGIQCLTRIELHIYIWILRQVVQAGLDGGLDDCVVDQGHHTLQHLHSGQFGTA